MHSVVVVYGKKLHFPYERKKWSPARRILRIYIESASLLLLATPQARLCFYARSSHREFKKNKYMNVEKEKHGFFSERVTQKKLCNLNCAARLIFEKRLQNDRYTYMYLLKIYKKFVTQLNARTDILYYFPFFFHFVHVSYSCRIIARWFWITYVCCVVIRYGNAFCCWMWAYARRYS